MAEKGVAHMLGCVTRLPALLSMLTQYMLDPPLQSPQARGSAYEPKVPGFGYKFDYISPQNPIVSEILAEKCPQCDPKSVPGSGPAPVLMRFSDLRAATPLWEELSEWIETHEHAKKALGGCKGGGGNREAESTS